MTATARTSPDPATSGGQHEPTPTVLWDEFSRPFWEGLQEGRFLLQWCPQCRAAVYYPRALCPRCHTTGLEWFEASGCGQVYSHTTVRRPTRPFGTDVPFVVALVDLDEGARMLARLTGVEPGGVRIGLEVTVRTGRVGDLCVPVFRPAVARPGPPAPPAPGDPR